MRYKYIEETLIYEELGEYGTYGIESDDESFTIHDVSCNKDDIENIVYQLNEHDVSLIHIRDVINDMLAM